MRIVLDTASFIAAIRSRKGAASEILRLVLADKLIVLLDLKLSLEYREVALRPEHVAASSLDEREILRIIQLLEEVAEATEILTKVRPLSSDPNDDLVLDLAINGGADAIVTNNVKHFKPAAVRYKIMVATPSQFLQYLARKVSFAH